MEGVRRLGMLFISFMLGAMVTMIDSYKSFILILILTVFWVLLWDFFRSAERRRFLEENRELLQSKRDKNCM